MTKPFSASSYSETLCQLPADLIESEYNRIGDARDFVDMQKRALILTEIKRRAKLRGEPVEEPLGSPHCQ